MHKPKVAFVCVHNSCRSQIAEALGKLLASDVFESYSAGTMPKDHINQDAVALMKKRYGLDMEKDQRSKLLGELPAVDIIITMGCNVACPNVPCKYREDWGLEDPSDQKEAAFIKTMDLIESKILNLKKRIVEQTLND
ncbi:MAG: arsenate reductase ArsC [Erysipelotrichaceae bacterium]|nr:arsenate reductase ArsC [Erysipelotrichaceae bacterium]MDY5251225.1 arsenate reductase ArsC [Erysipelotrichaceae bacterium]